VPHGGGVRRVQRDALGRLDLPLETVVAVYQMRIILASAERR